MLNYKELEIRAAEGLHDDCFELIERHTPPRASVIDLAAGAGAFSARLADAGFDVSANDIDTKPWQPTHIPRLSLDLDEPLESHLPASGYQTVVAMEVIEHLQNPSKLLADCKRLVAPGGIILLSTPNVLDLDSRLIYLRRGVLFHISPQSYEATGHRTILPDWLLEIFIENEGLEVVDKRWGGTVPPSGRGSIFHTWGRRIFKRVMRLLVKSGDDAQLDANYLIYVLRERPGKNRKGGAAD